MKSSRKLQLGVLQTKLSKVRRLLSQATAEHTQQRVSEQVLVDTIMQLDEVLLFKSFVADCIASGDGTALHTPWLNSMSASDNAPRRYVTALLSKVTPAEVQAMLQWSTADWMQRFHATYTKIPMLLDLVSRQPTSPAGQEQADTTDYMTIAQQQLNEAVDSYASMGVLGFIYLNVVGQAIGPCVAANHITGQLEAPSTLHWLTVVQRLQLTHSHLIQLAAGYQVFVQGRQGEHRAQLAFSNLINCTNTCSVQLLAAAKEAQAAAPSSSTVWEGLAPAAAAAANGTAAAAAGGSSEGRPSSNPTVKTSAQPRVVMMQLPCQSRLR